MSSQAFLFLKEQFLAEFISALEQTIPKDRSELYWGAGVQRGLVSAFYMALQKAWQAQKALSQNSQESLAWIFERIKNNHAKARELENTSGLCMEELEHFHLNQDTIIDIPQLMLRECLLLYRDVQAYQKQLASYFQAPSADMRYDPQNPKAHAMRLQAPGKRVSNHSKLLSEIGSLIMRELFQENIESLLNQTQAQALISFLFDQQDQQPMPQFAPEIFDRILMDLQKLFRLSYQDSGLLKRLVNLVRSQQLAVYKVFGAVADAHEFGHKREFPTKIPVLEELLKMRTMSVAQNGCFSASSQESTEIPKLAAKL